MLLRIASYRIIQGFREYLWVKYSLGLFVSFCPPSAYFLSLLSPAAVFNSLYRSWRFLKNNTYEKDSF
jgi:hypothetical protein